MKTITNYVLSIIKRESASNLSRKTGIQKTRCWRIKALGSELKVNELEIIADAYGMTLENILWNVTKVQASNGEGMSA